MALTDAQLTDVRRYAGYSLTGTMPGPVSALNDTVFMVFGMVQMTLYTRLTTLSVTEEAIITGYYLPQLQTLEQAIPTASQNLDTKKAAVWERNQNEINDRFDLFCRMRRMLCSFLGCAAGPGIDMQGGGAGTSAGGTAADGSNGAFGSTSSGMRMIRS